MVDLYDEIEETSQSEEEDIIITKAKTPTKKSTTKKGVQFRNLPEKKPKKERKKPVKGKDMGKKAEKDQSTSGGDDPGSESSSSSDSSVEGGVVGVNLNKKPGRSDNYHQASKNGKRPQENKVQPEP